ncbi:class I SAM-dependent methyltransferase, partial [Pseudomonas syringae group genomosp. 7]|uniref:class I SAM-dependent methyltransferase n=1 Tax=Pseudomonas syringae group genomosp. 7 TaxID=251699 RepID=UPI0037702CC2
MTSEGLAILLLQLLAALYNVPTETRRLFHGRGREWPGLEHITVDWMQGGVLVSLFQAPLEHELE